MVSSLLATSNVDKIEERLANREAARKVVKIRLLVDDLDGVKLASKIIKIGVDVNNYRPRSSTWVAVFKFGL